MEDVRGKMSGISKKLENKIVCFRKDVSVKTLDDSASIRIFKGAVGVLTGGFFNRKLKDRVVSFLDVQITITTSMGGVKKKNLMIVSVPIDFLKFGTDERIN